MTTATRQRSQTEQQIVVPWPLRGPLRTCPETLKLRLTGSVVAKRGIWTIGGSLNSDLDRWGTRSISVRIARTDGGSVPRCSCILPHLANSQWRGKIDSREESSRARGFLSQAARSSLLHLSRCWDRAARMEPIGPLGALRSTDRWNQVSVDPIEGPLPEHVGAEQPGAVSWASPADRQRARSFKGTAANQRTVATGRPGGWRSTRAPTTKGRPSCRLTYPADQLVR